MAFLRASVLSSKQANCYVAVTTNYALNNFDFMAMINFLAILTILSVANLASITSFFKQLSHLFNKKAILPNCWY
jgi:hypothetical protein